MVERSSPHDIRMRFLGALRELPRAAAARLTQIDYDREMALVAVELSPTTRGDVLGVARIIATPENDQAEFAVMVRSDVKGRGIGFQLMTDILACARRRGIARVHGEVLAENTTMLAMAEELGFSREGQGSGTVRITLEL